MQIFQERKLRRAECGGWRSHAACAAAPGRRQRRCRGAIGGPKGEQGEWFENMIINNSVVLLKGFYVKNAHEFNNLVEAFGMEDIRFVGPTKQQGLDGQQRSPV